MITPLAGPRRSSICPGRRPASPSRPGSMSAIAMSLIITDGPATLCNDSLSCPISGGRAGRAGTAALSIRLKPCRTPRSPALADPADSQVAQLASVRGRGRRRDVLAGRLAVSRAMAGNTLSWAYTFEWPIFAIFGVVFWVKTIRDELHPAADGGKQATRSRCRPGPRPRRWPRRAQALRSGAGSGRSARDGRSGRRRACRVQRLPGQAQQRGQGPRQMARPALAGDAATQC